MSEDKMKCQEQYHVKNKLQFIIHFLIACYEDLK